jgi:hypothetical protein
MQFLELRKPTDYYDVPVLNNSGLSQFRAKLLGLPSFNVSEATLRKGQLVHLAVYQPLLLPAEELSSEITKLAVYAKKCRTLQAFLSDPRTVYEQDTYALWEGKVPVKVKPDARLPIMGHDLKTTACKTRLDFLDKFGEYGYWRQAYFYRTVTGCKHYFFTGISKANFNTFLVDVSQFKVEMKQAKEEVHELIKLYVQQYPKYPQTALQLFNHG